MSTLIGVTVTCTVVSVVLIQVDVDEIASVKSEISALLDEALTLTDPNHVSQV